MTTVAVCIPTMPTRRKHLMNALASVSEQTRSADEIHIAVDRVNVDVPGDGAAPTRNRALRAASTDWIAFLDDDDVFYPHHLHTLLTAAEETKADLIYSWFNAVGATAKLSADIDTLTAKVFGHPAAETIELVRHSNHIPITYLVRRELLLDVGGFPDLTRAPLHPYPPHAPLEDWGLLLSLIDVNAVFHHVPEITWEYRFHPDGTTETNHRSLRDVE